MASVAFFLQENDPNGEDLRVFFQRLQLIASLVCRVSLKKRLYWKSKMARIWMNIDINWNVENDCHSHICEPLFSIHSKTMMLKTKVDIHVFFSC